MKPKIERIMKILEKYYSNNKRTTLNRMRKEKKPNAFKILISCLLSLRTRDENTEKVSKKLFAVADTPEKILNLNQEELEKLIYSSGYYRNKAKTLKYVSREIKERFNGKVPDSEEELLSIKGIGRKTANVVLAFAFNKLAIPVDVNVHRTANRLGLFKTKNAEKTEKELKEILPKQYWKEINGIFILHGRKICVPISPHCSICPVIDYCRMVGVGKSR